MEPSFKNLPTVTRALTESFSEATPLSALPADEYAEMRYPKFPALMRFSTKRYGQNAFGSVFSMDTRALGGLMQLCTLVFTPNVGTDVPLLLIDVMSMGKKRVAFVEYYDLTEKGAICPTLASIAKRYADIPNYAEKPAWYVGERAPYSLIKGGADDARLVSMLTDSVSAYASLCAENVEPRAENRVKLRAFIERMATEGNPSSATLKKVLGAKQADAFFRTRVMPSNGAGE